MENISVLQNFDSSCLRTDPYNYICIENALPQDIYDKLDAEYPKDTILEHAKGVDNDTCYRLNASLAIQDNLLQGIWKYFKWRLEFLWYRLSYRKWYKQKFVD